jgi:sugar lactone lactonase YvrE
LNALRLHKPYSFVVALGVVLTMCGCPQAVAQARVTTVAGGYLGEGKLATSAALQSPQYVAIDRFGNLYIADSLDHRVRKLYTTGIVRTLTGTGIAAFSGDGGPARSANIYGPSGIAVNSSSEVIFSDTGNNRIRKISSSGVISTIAGTGTAGFGGDGGPATAAMVNQPSGLAIDSSGNVFFADVNNQRIREIDTFGNIHTVAGNGHAGFSGDGGLAALASLNSPQSVLADSRGDLYIADTLNLRVRKVGTTGKITTFAGSGLGGCTGDGGLATSARMGNIRALAIHAGYLVISNAGCDFIREVNLTTNIITTIAGTKTSLGTGGFDGNGHAALQSFFARPTGILYDHSGNLLIVDTLNDQVRKVDANTQIVSALAGGYIGDGGVGTAASLNGPEDLTFDSGGNMYVADTLNNRVRKVAPDGTITTFAGTGVSGNSGDGGPATAATLSLPLAVAADNNGNVYVGDEFGSILRRVDASGIITSFFSSNDLFPFFTSLVTDASGNIYGADPSNCVVWKVTPAAESTVVAGVTSVCGYNSDGITATTAFLGFPYGIGFDKSGDLYIADSGNNRVRRVNTSGIISTYAGNGTCGFGGDGGPAKAAELCNISAVAFDSTGHLYISDTGNLRVRVVGPKGIIRTWAGTGVAGYNGNARLATQTNLDLPLAIKVSPSSVPYVVDGIQYRVREIH